MRLNHYGTGGGSSFPTGFYVGLASRWVHPAGTSPADRSIKENALDRRVGNRGCCSRSTGRSRCGTPTGSCAAAHLGSRRGLLGQSHWVVHRRPFELGTAIRRHGAKRRGIARTPTTTCVRARAGAVCGTIHRSRNGQGFNRGAAMTPDEENPDPSVNSDNSAAAGSRGPGPDGEPIPVKLTHEQVEWGASNSVKKK